jgi:hypothetical protein
VKRRVNDVSHESPSLPFFPLGYELGPCASSPVVGWTDESAEKYSAGDYNAYEVKRSGHARLLRWCSGIQREIINRNPSLCR